MSDSYFVEVPDNVEFLNIHLIRSQQSSLCSSDEESEQSQSTHSVCDDDYTPFYKAIDDRIKDPVSRISSLVHVLIHETANCDNQEELIYNIIKSFFGSKRLNFEYVRRSLPSLIKTLLELSIKK